MKGPEHNTPITKEHTESSLSKALNNFKRYGRLLDRHAQTSFLAIYADIRFVTHEKGFKLEDALKTIDGPVIEVGGPTDTSHFLTDIKNSRVDMHVSNITPGHPVYERKKGEVKLSKYEGKVDFLADARRMPLADGSIGVLFASCLPNIIESEIVPEAERVLKGGGLFIFAGTSDEIIKEAEAAGLQVVVNLRIKSKRSEEERYDVVFRKPAKPQNTQMPSGITLIPDLQ